MPEGGKCERDGRRHGRSGLAVVQVDREGPHWDADIGAEIYGKSGREQGGIQEKRIPGDGSKDEVAEVGPPLVC